MARSNRLLAILQLFENGHSIWTVEAIGCALAMPTSTTYRYVRELVQAGFLDPVTGAGYALGPAFIRYDRILRQTDHLIRVSGPVMEKLLARTSQHATVILCRRFKDCVMCVHEVHGRQPHSPISYERGAAMPLFVGATSKVILANLPDRTLKAVYLSNEKAIRRTLQVSNWMEFRTQLREIRRIGYALTDSEVAKGRIGLAAPILRDGQLIAGISLIGMLSNAERARIPDYIPHVASAAADISKALSSASTAIPR